MSGNSAVLKFSTSLPPLSHWLLNSTHTVSLVLADSEVGLCFFFVIFCCCLFSVIFLFSVLPSSCVFLPPCPLSPSVSVLNAPRPQSLLSVSADKSTMVHLWGLQGTEKRADTRDITEYFCIIPFCFLLPTVPNYLFDCKPFVNKQVVTKWLLRYDNTFSLPTSRMPMLGQWPKLQTMTNHDWWCQLCPNRSLLQNEWASTMLSSPIKWMKMDSFNKI